MEILTMLMMKTSLMTNMFCGHGAQIPLSKGNFGALSALVRSLVT